MLYPTADPTTFRAVIVLDETDTKRTEVDLTVHADALGFMLTYNGHQLYSRPYKGAPWGGPQAMVMNLRPDSAAAHRMEALVLNEVLDSTVCRWELPSE